ncbi:ABC transporter permease [Kibdelosporangium aridum]|uniref:ABC transporter permease n=1 Tax=Kibdelosporangium aridum TaxID=2030 RepID=UPI0035E7288E
MRISGALDLISEVAASLRARPSRLVLTTIGTVVGTAAIVATLGLAATAGNHIVTRFDELAATEVVVVPARSSVPNEPPVNILPWDAAARIDRLNGVTAAGTLTKLDIGTRRVRTVELVDPQAAAVSQIPVVAASSGLLGAVRGTVSAGRWFDEGHNTRADRVAVLGKSAAEQLNVNRLDGMPAVFVGDELFTVIGLLDTTEREASLTGAVIVPDGAARAAFGVDRLAQIVVDTDIGAARQVAAETPFALAPATPELVATQVPADPQLVQARVASDVQALLLLLGAVSLVIGGVGIANITLVSVLERRAEIALRRSLGARRRQIAAQFLVESGATGLLGGVLGSALGVVTIVLVAWAKTWTPVLYPWLPVAGVAFGALIGLLAGTYPSIRAARLEPVAVLRGE